MNGISCCQSVSQSVVTEGKVIEGEFIGSAAKKERGTERGSVFRERKLSEFRTCKRSSPFYFNDSINFSFSFFITRMEVHSLSYPFFASQDL